MQVFLPYKDFKKCVQVLDDKRLKNQRNECLVILKAILGEIDAWKRHPAVRMWDWYEVDLVKYAREACDEMIARGIKTKHTDITPFLELLKKHGRETDTISPSWLGNEELHLSHRRALVYKDPEFYGPKFPGVEPAIPNKKGSLPYVWMGMQESHYI
jgi:hypothetical protein